MYKITVDQFTYKYETVCMQGPMDFLVSNIRQEYLEGAIIKKNAIDDFNNPLY